jgi:peroxiredoxin
MRPVALLLLLAGCKALLNKDQTREPAPPLDGGTWISGKAPEQEWQLVTFFQLDSGRAIDNVPRLMALRREFGPKGVAVVAVTREPVEITRAWAKKHEAKYEIQAEGAMAFERWGVGAWDDTPIYLVDPNGWVLAEGYDDCAEILRERLGS